MNQSHIDWFGPSDAWPIGGWSLYKISGDQIADRVVRERVNVDGGYYEGDAIARHSWCGYIGIFATLPELMKAIEQAKE